MIKFAVISFPGTNCETEAVRAFKRNGMEAEVVLWNDESILNGSRLAEFDGYCIAGGFSYEDRGRSGVVAAQDPISEVLKKEADAGKVVLGICNGAQILVETGLVPGFESKEIGMALAWNEMKSGDEIVDTGFYNAWSFLKNVAPKNRSAFNDFDALLHVPFAHGEGRFMINDELLVKLEENDQILFKYSTKEGVVDANYPVTPNGATASVAGLCNPAGNVMAIMPHPERDPLGGTGDLIFKSIREYLEANTKTAFKPLGQLDSKVAVAEKASYDLEIYIRLIITDNTERTIEEAFLRKGFKLHLDRFMFYGINLEVDVNVQAFLTKILTSGELANFNKHLVYAKTAEGFFQYDASDCFTSKKLDFDQSVIAFDEKDFVGQEKMQTLNAHVGKGIIGVSHGILWNISGVDELIMNELVASNMFHNPYSMYLAR